MKWENSRIVTTVDTTDFKLVTDNELNAKIIKMINASYTNIPCTTKSAAGAYYGTLCSISDLGITSDRIVGLVITNWGGALASFNIYVQENKIKVFSDVSQTISSIGVRIAYI